MSLSDEFDERIAAIEWAKKNIPGIELIECDGCRASLQRGYEISPDDKVEPESQTYEAGISRHFFIDVLKSFAKAKARMPELESIEAGACKVRFAPTDIDDPASEENYIEGLKKAFGPPVGDKPPETIKEGRYKGLAAEDVFAAAVPPTDS